MDIPAIGTLPIVIEARQRLLFPQGVDLYHQQIQPIEDDFLQGNSTLLLLFDESVPIMDSSGEFMVSAELFIGMLESLLIKIRAQNFPNTQFELNRRHFRDVNQPAAKIEDNREILTVVFKDGWDVYEEMNRWVLSHIKLGIQMSDGSRFVAELDQDEDISNKYPSSIEHQIGHWIGKFLKSFDLMYMQNLMSSVDLRDVYKIDTEDYNIG